MKALFLFSVLLILLAQTPSKKDDYDPDKLGPFEVACGRPNSKKSAPCKCMKHRQAAQMVEQDKCKVRHLDNVDKMFDCLAKIPACPPVQDAESIEHDDNGNRMPTQCSRTCTKARCECCKT